MKTTGTERQLLDMFTAEVKERAADLEVALLALDNAEGDGKRRLQAEVLKMAHSLKGAAGLVEIRPVEAICHRMEDFVSLAQKEDRLLTREEADLLLMATDSIAEAGRLLGQGEPVPADHGKDILDGGNGNTPGAVAGVPYPIPRASDLDGSLRVSGDRLDRLLHRSGELLTSDAILHSRADQVAALREQARNLRAGALADVHSLENGLRELSASLADDGRQLHTTATALSQEVRKARMQPFSEACMGLPRIVRDMAEASGKNAVLEIRGGEVEIDRSVLSGLQDALRHLVRNAVAHGIEPTEERRAAGKPETGRIEVSASLAGDRMQVRVSDDGRGFDIEGLRIAAGKAGLSQSGDEAHLLRQAFEPGVTTSTTVTEHSGRGVGLEIVCAAAEAMRGLVEVSHAPGGGAAFTLTMPLTLATVHALEIVAGGLPFAIDVASVQRIMRIPAEDLIRSDDTITLTENGRSVPVLDLAAWLGLPISPSRPRRIPAVLLGPAEAGAAVLVDEVCAEMELLARALGPRLERVRHYSGATVLPDGRIALLLNASALTEAAGTGKSGELHGRLIAVQAKRKVLVVDDSPSIRTLLRLVLEASGYEVAVAADGTQAMEYLQMNRTDAVVADVDMPSMDGYSLTEAIRRSDNFRNLPVILVTGRETPEDKARGMEAGANAYITKAGFDQEQFLEIVGQVA